MMFIIPAACSGNSKFEKGSFGLSLNYPGFGFRYFQNANLAIEPRLQIDQGVVIGGVRGYRYLKKFMDKVLLLSGFEADYISYEGEESKGIGFTGGVFLGAEYFILKRLGFQMDFGPVYVSLKDRDTSITANGISISINVSINYYFKIR